MKIFCLQHWNEDLEFAINIVFNPQTKQFLYDETEQFESINMIKRVVELAGVTCIRVERDVDYGSTKISSKDLEHENEYGSSSYIGLFDDYNEKAKRKRKALEAKFIKIAKNWDALQVAMV